MPAPEVTDPDTGHIGIAQPPLPLALRAGLGKAFSDQFDNLIIRFHVFWMHDRSITVTEASRNFSDLVNRSYYRGETTLLMRSGEAVAMMVPVGAASVPGRDWLAKWHAMPHLDSEDADDFGKTLEAARAHLPTVESLWD